MVYTCPVFCCDGAGYVGAGYDGAGYDGAGYDGACFGHPLAPCVEIWPSGQLYEQELYLPHLAL